MYLGCNFIFENSVLAEKQKNIIKNNEENS